MLAYDTCGSIDWHLPKQGQCEGLEKQSEPLDLALSWPFQRLDLTTLATLDPGQTTFQVALVLEDVQVTPLPYWSPVVATNRTAVVRTPIIFIKTISRLDHDANLAVCTRKMR